LETGADSNKLVGNVEKILDKLLRGESDANLRFDELCHLLQAKGFRMRVSGSHHIFTRPGVMERINIQRAGARAKPYQVRQVRKILATYKLL
jgi:predicted RNA binding protein YcfA (HicA-like mRNA interferase family)